MATLLHSESRRLYSWWWDSHNSPKNSKWLQENLTDMDAKVKAMIKLIEEDADSFARRAEMYYKKRPELMKLVEEFYRAYRALAERYNHATVELRQAHRTMAEAFPNQAHYMLPDDSPSCSSGPEAEPRTPEGSHLICAFLEPDDLQKYSLGHSSIHNALKKNVGSSEQLNYGMNKKGLKQLNDMFGLAQLSPEEQNLQSQAHSEAEQAAGKADIEIQTLKMALVKIQSEKDAIVLQYQKSLEKLSDLERELNNAQTDAGGLGEQASKAEIEINILKEALVELKAERDARLVKYNQCLERVASLETLLSVAQQDAKGLDERTTRAETEAESLRQEISRLEAEKNAGLIQYEECLIKISVLETKLSIAEENSRMLTEQFERSEMEVKALRKNLTELNEEKEAVAALYKQCLETIAKLESEILYAQENSERLNREIMIGAEKLKSAEKHCDVLETSNRSLRLEADNLVQKIAMKDQELSEKHTELERLQNVLQEEHSRFLQIEAALETLQKLHSQSQAEQNSLALELQYGLQLLKDLELCKQGFKEEMQQIVAENRTLHELNFCSTMSVKNQQREISKLKEIKEKLEREISVKAEESNTLQQETHQVKNEIQLLTNRYQAMLKQVEAAGLDPECFAASVKDLQNENSKLKEACEKERDEKEALYEKSTDMDRLSRENSLMESSLSRLNEELDGLKCAANKFQGSCQVLEEEKSVLVAEKATLLSQLQVITESMQKLLENNTLLEKSLSGANMELQDLRDKSSSLEEVCKSLNHEKASLLNEKSILVSQLETVEMRLGVLETRFTKLEEKCSDMEKDNKSTVNQVEELCASLLAQKNEHASHKESSDIRLANLQNVVHLLQEEHRLGKIEFEEQLDKAVNAQVEIFILQQFIEDLEQKNLTLFIECQKHVEASKFSDKVITELESENLEQQMELEFLLDEIQKLRIGIRKVYGALQIDPDSGHNKGIKLEEIPILHILDHIEGLKGSLVKSKDEEQQLLVENSVLLTLLWQLRSDGAELESKKKIQEQEFEVMKEQYSMLQKDKLELLEMNRQLRFAVTRGEETENILKSELGTMQVDLLDLQGANLVLQQENSKVLEEKNALLKSVVDLKDTLSVAEKENSVIFHEALASSNLSLVYECFGTEKVLELRSLTEDLSTLHHMNNKLKQEVEVLREKFEAKEAENVYLNESAERMDKELHQARNLNDHLGHKMTITEDLLDKKEAELLEMKQRLKAAEALNAEFCKNIEELKMEHQETKLTKENLEMQLLKLSEDCMNQKKEINRLNEANRSFLSEIGYLRQEIEQQRVREETLNSELLEKSQEFQLWEAEAATFYFDLQISSVSEALFENKVNELTGVCSSLEDENAAKSLEIEQMRGRVSLLESQIGGLKGQLSAYIPVITSLKEDFLSLERTALCQTKKTDAITGETEVVVIETSLPEDACQNLKENGSTVIPDGVSDLLNIQTRIRAVQNVILEEIGRHAKEETLIANIGVESQTEVTGNSNLKVALYPENVRNTTFDLMSQKKSENGSMMKDIPLDQVSDSPASKNCRRENSGTDDQMLELWETAEQDSCDDNSKFSEANRPSSVPTEDVITCHQSDNSVQCPNSSPEFEVEKELGVDKLELAKTIRETNRDGKRRMILERLASDAQKLTILKTTMEDLKKKTDTNKRGKGKKGNDVEYETVRRQIREVEEAVVQLVNTNEQLMKDIEESPSSLDRETSLLLEKGGHIHRKRVTEQARIVSEQIGRLQFEVQNIQYILLKLSEEEKNRKNRFSERTSVLLRKIIHNNDKNSSKRRTKMCFCGCSRPSTNDN